MEALSPPYTIHRIPPIMSIKKKTTPDTTNIAVITNETKVSTVRLVTSVPWEGRMPKVAAKTVDNKFMFIKTYLYVNC